MVKKRDHNFEKYRITNLTKQWIYFEILQAKYSSVRYP